MLRFESYFIMYSKHSQDRLDEEKLSRCVDTIASNLRFLSYNKQQWLLYDIKRFNWPEWNGSVWTSLPDAIKSPSVEEIETALTYMCEHMEHITANDQQKLLFRIANLQIKLNDNLVVCKKCGTILESTFGHDFQTCPCGSGVFVDL